MPRLSRRPGDRVVTTILEHHQTRRALGAGVTVEVIGITEDYQLDLNAFRQPSPNRYARSP